MNKLVQIALKKPYTFVVLAILIVVFGVMTVIHAPTDVFPNIQMPVSSVVWLYDGLMPQETEGRVTRVFEQMLTQTVEGIKTIVSTSYFGHSIINIFLQDGVDLAGSEADIVGISQTSVKALPPDVAAPMVMRLFPSQVPVAVLQVESDVETPAELYNLCVMRIRPMLVTIPGAILPHPYGGQDMQVMINVDQDKLRARHLTTEDVHQAIEKQNLVLPGGDMKIKETDWLVLTNASPLKIEEFDDIPIKREGNSFIHLRDVATVRLAGRVQTNSVLVDGKQAVIVVVMKSSEASTIDIVDGIRKMIPRIQEVVPSDVKVSLLSDSSVFVRDAIADVVHEMVIAAALVGFIVLLMLGSWRPTVIVLTSIPLSILSSIICLHLLEQSINIMTLGGLALAVGILVDNAAVMIENIDTHLAMGKPLEEAIIDAANQIILPTFVATLAITIVWVPLFHLTGIAGWIFPAMAEAVVFAMLASFILTYTLVPTMPVDPRAECLPAFSMDSKRHSNDSAIGTLHCLSRRWLIGWGSLRPLWWCHWYLLCCLRSKGRSFSPRSKGDCCRCTCGRLSVYVSRQQAEWLRSFRTTFGRCCRVMSMRSSVIAAFLSAPTTSPSFPRRRSAPRIATSPSP